VLKHARKKLTTPLQKNIKLFITYVSERKIQIKRYQYKRVILAKRHVRYTKKALTSSKHFDNQFARKVVRSKLMLIGGASEKTNRLFFPTILFSKNNVDIFRRDFVRIRLLYLYATFR